MGTYKCNEYYDLIYEWFVLWITFNSIKSYGVLYIIYIKTPYDFIIYILHST